MNHAFDPTAVSNISCSLGDFREPLKRMQATIKTEKVRGSPN